MPLSEYEQRVLEQMERQLTSDDPRLATTLTSSGRRPILHYVLGGIGAVAGLLLLVIGAAKSLVWLGVLGFVVMFAAVAVAFTKPRKPGPTGMARPNGSAAPRASRKPAKKSFMERMEARWDHRREQGR